MHRRRFTWLILLLAAVLLLPATPVLADSDPPDDDGVVIWNEDYTLEEGQRLDGDLIVFNGDVTLEPSSCVEGSVIVWNGNADVEGTIEKDLVVSGGDIYLGDDAQVEGDVVCSWNCELEQEEQARVDGSIVAGIPLRGFPAVSSLPTLRVSGLERVLGWMFRATRSIVAILVIAAVAGLVALIWPHQTEQVRRVVAGAPWPSLGIGLLTVIAVTALVIALTITCCLSPIAALATLALGAAGLFGWIGVGALVGERLLQAFNTRDIAPLWAAGLGTLIITLVGTGLTATFCLAPLGWLLLFILGCLGLGAVVLTRFGTTPYGPDHRTPPPPVSPPAPVETPEPHEPPQEETRSE